MITWRIPTLGNRWQELAQVLDRQTTSSHDVRHTPFLLFSLCFIWLLRKLLRDGPVALSLIMCTTHYMCMHLCLTWTRLFTFGCHTFCSKYVYLDSRRSSAVRLQCLQFCDCLSLFGSPNIRFEMTQHDKKRRSLRLTRSDSGGVTSTSLSTAASSPLYNDVTGLLTNQRTYCPSSAILFIY